MDIRLHGGTTGLDAARMLFERWAVRCVFLSANLDLVTRAQARRFSRWDSSASRSCRAT
jgi:hypothetical protein